MSFAQEGVPPAGGGSALTQQSSAATSIQARWRQTRTAEPPRTPASQGEWGECTIYAFTAVLQAQLEIGVHTWIKCFDSAVDDTSTAAAFHAACDQFSETVSIADSTLGYTFGGYASASWAGNSWITTATTNFIFGLGPGSPERFDTNGADTQYQASMPDYWPTWGSEPNHDLKMGQSGLLPAGGPLGEDGLCQQGNTYAGSPNQVCGGRGNWGETRLQVWRVDLDDEDPRGPSECPQGLSFGGGRAQCRDISIGLDANCPMSSPWDGGQRSIPCPTEADVIANPELNLMADWCPDFCHPNSVDVHCPNVGEPGCGGGSVAGVAFPPARLLTSRAQNMCVRPRYCA